MPQVIEGRVTPTVVDIRCDICGSSCKNEHAQLFASWGYESGMDGQVHNCYICEKCYNKMLVYIHKLGGKVEVKNTLLKGELP